MEILFEKKLKKTLKFERLTNQFGNTMSYQGGYYDNQRNGFGVFSLTDGSYYKG